MSLIFLRLVLVVRCIESLLFAGYLASMSSSSLSAIAAALSHFGAIDGALALLIALLALIISAPAGLVIVASIGGILRVGVAIVLWRGPGAADFAVTVSLYAGSIAALGFLFGLLECLAAYQLRKTTGRSSLSMALMIAGMAAAVLGIIGFFLEPMPSTVRLLLMIGVMIQAVALLVAALGPWSERPYVQGVDARA